MICLGYTPDQKREAIDAYLREHQVENVFVFNADRFSVATGGLDPHVECVAWGDIIRYVFYYRILQETGPRTLIVINEPLRTQQRSELTYNCLRNFLQQTEHQIIFSWLPIIDTEADAAILFDFDTRSRWRRTPVSDLPWSEAVVRIGRVVVPEFDAVSVPVDAKTVERYRRSKRELIDNIGLKDPHTIPRNLYLEGGRSKLFKIGSGRSYVGRNNRFKIDGLTTYRAQEFPAAPYTVFEFPHNFIEFADFVALSGQDRFDVLCADDLPVERWYLQRYREWAEGVGRAYAALPQG